MCFFVLFLAYVSGIIKQLESLAQLRKQCSATQNVNYYSLLVHFFFFWNLCKLQSEDLSTCAKKV